MMRILLVNHYAGSPGHGMEFRPFFFAREWVRRGHEVRIVASAFAHTRSTQPKRERGLRWSQEEFREGVCYEWLPNCRYSGNGLWRIINMLLFVVQLFARVLYYVIIKRPNVVIASSTYPLDIFPCWLIARLAGAKLIFEVHDLWPLSPMEIGGMSRYHPFIMIMALGERFAYKVCDKCVSLLPAAKTHMVEHGLAPEKFFYVPNGIVLEDWEREEALPEEHREAIMAFRTRFRFLLGYAGAMGPANALEVLCDAAPHLAELGIGLVMVGSGPNENALKARVKTLGASDSVRFLPAVKKNAVPAFLNLMDAVTVVAWPHALYRFGVCLNKVFDYMMAAKPIVFGVLAGNNPVKEARCGVWLDAISPENFAEKASILFKMSQEEREHLGRNGKEFVLQYHEYGILAEKFLNLMQIER